MEADGTVASERWVAITGRLAYRAPVDWVIHGMLAEDSAASKPEFYLWIVRMALYVPLEVIDLSWSDRFGGGTETYRPDAPETSTVIKNASVHVTEEYASGVVLLDPPGGADNVLMQEARAYGLLLMGNVPGAIEELGRVLRYEPRYESDRALAERAAEMLSQIQSGHEDDVLGRIGAWRRQSMDVLGIVPE